LCIFTVLGDFERVSKIFRLMVPVLFVIGIITIALTVISDFGQSGAVSGYKPGRMSPNWIISAIVFMAYNSLGMTTMAGNSAINAKDSKNAYIGAAAGTLCLGLLTIFLLKALLSDMAFSASLDLPMLGFSCRISPVLNIIYAVVLYGAVYSTGASTYYGFSTKLNHKIYAFEQCPDGLTISAHTGTNAHKYALEHASYTLFEGTEKEKVQDMKYEAPHKVSIYDGEEKITEFDVVHGFRIGCIFEDKKTYVIFDDEERTRLISDMPIMSDISVSGAVLFDFVGYSVRTEGYNGLRAIYSYDSAALALLQKYSITEMGVLGAKNYGIDTVLDIDYGHGEKKVILKNGDFVGKLTTIPRDSVFTFACSAVGYEDESGKTLCSRVASEIITRAYVIIRNNETGEETVFYSHQNKKDITSASAQLMSDMAKLVNEDKELALSLGSKLPKPKKPQIDSNAYEPKPIEQPTEKHLEAWKKFLDIGYRPSLNKDLKMQYFEFNDMKVTLIDGNNNIPKDVRRVVELTKNKFINATRAMKNAKEKNIPFSEGDMNAMCQKLENDAQKLIPNYQPKDPLELLKLRNQQRIEQDSAKEEAKASEQAKQIAENMDEKQIEDLCKQIVESSKAVIDSETEKFFKENVHLSEKDFAGYEGEKSKSPKTDEAKKEASTKMFAKN
jgi:hypothetical protein